MKLRSVLQRYNLNSRYHIILKRKLPLITSLNIEFKTKRTPNRDLSNFEIEINQTRLNKLRQVEAVLYRSRQMYIMLTANFLQTKRQFLLPEKQKEKKSINCLKQRGCPELLSIERNVRQRPEFALPVQVIQARVRLKRVPVSSK